MIAIGCIVIVAGILVAKDWGTPTDEMVATQQQIDLQSAFPTAPTPSQNAASTTLQSQRTTFMAADIAATYRSELIPAASTPGRIYTLTLDATADMAATFISDYQNGEAPLIETGDWSLQMIDASTARIIVVLRAQNGETLDNPGVLTFTVQVNTQGTITGLKSAASDISLWGAAGLSLERETSN